MVGPPTALVRLVPRVACEWELDAPEALWREVDGTLCFIDISGFTNLSERLAMRGRIGVEELTEVLNRVFGTMLEIVFARGGTLLKFGGDALLLLFDGPDHPAQAACAAVEMRAALRGERERAAQARRRSEENVRALVEPSAPPPATDACVETTQALRAPTRLPLGLGRLFRRR